MGLSMQHAALRKSEIQAAPRTGDRHVHQAALFVQVAAVDAVLVREQTLFQPGDEHGVELQPLGRMHRHQVQRIVAVARLVFARFQRGVGEEGGETIVFVLVHKQRCRIDQFVQVFQPLFRFAPLRRRAFSAS